MEIVISHRMNELFVYQNTIFEVQATDAVQVEGDLPASDSDWFSGNTAFYLR
jgi:hypothetical protein